MKRIFSFIITGLTIFTGCNSSKAQIEIVEAFPNLSFEQPVDIQNPGDGTNRLFIVEQSGKIFVFENSPTTASKKLFLDISGKVLSGGEQGLLGLAFHPNYKSNGFFYVDYTTDNPRRTVISRFKVSSNDQDKADPSSELILLEVEQPYANHNGGQTTFGSDGYLYISFGDGGSGGDPQNNAQNLRSLLGKIIRIDVNNTSPGINYSIPNDNPLKGNTNGLREEIYAWGLRNVWRFSFDKPTNKLWAADVGQNAWEEIDIIENGKNYGWRIVEGNHCFNPSTNCDTENLTMPIWEYGHNQNGGYSITGGFVYRGKNAQEIYGKYVYADFVSGNIWSIEYDGSSATNNLIKTTSYQVSTFGVDQDNELYFASYGNGKLYKFKGSPSTKVGNIRLPENFQLFQNYPNPFNPTTTIEYSIPHVKTTRRVVFTTLKVCDILGNEVATLVNEFQQPGKYFVHFNVETHHGASLPSGVYFYTLKIGDSSSSEFQKSKKMVLLK
ncbi:MAG: PQQ-dependent sugar dehydrogenase [Bacteroidota bacterium]